MWKSTSSGTNRLVLACCLITCICTVLSTTEYKKILETRMRLSRSACIAGRGEASALKSRECLALGLPLVLAYKDTDLHGLQANFLLRIPNKEDNIQTHAQAIRDFAHCMRGRRVERDLISSIDQAAKERERVQFFEEIIASRSQAI
jgi:hypothetical protein